MNVNAFGDDLKALLCDACLARMEEFQARLLVEDRDTVMNDAAQYDLCKRCATKVHEWVASQ